MIGSLHDLITWPTFGKHENSSLLKNFVSANWKSILKLGNNGRQKLEAFVWEKQLLRKYFMTVLKICMENHASVTGWQKFFSHTNASNFRRLLQSLRQKILRLPNFNMLFQLVLTKFFKSELFSCLPKAGHVIKSCKEPIVLSIFWKIYFPIIKLITYCFLLNMMRTARPSRRCLSYVTLMVIHHLVTDVHN